MKKGHEIMYLECKEPERAGSLTAVARDMFYILWAMAPCSWIE
jgi:hypothetical protein